MFSNCSNSKEFENGCGITILRSIDKDQILFPKWSMIEELIYKLCDEISRSMYSPDLIYAIQRGGLIPGVMISHRLNIREFDSISIKRSVSDDIFSNFNEPTLKPINCEIKGSNILIVDDIIGEGKTMMKAINEVSKITRSYKVAALYVNENKCNIWESIDYYTTLVTKWVCFPWERKECLL